MTLIRLACAQSSPSRVLGNLLLAAGCILSVQSALGVTLAWDRNSEPDIAGYILHSGTNSGVYLSAVNVRNVTTNMVSGLTLGVTYYFAVTAYNTSGLESDFSNEISYTADSVKPVVSISSPVADARLTNGIVSLQGLASGNQGVAQVLFRVGDGPFQAATGTTHWSALISLAAGANAISVKSVDLSGNESLPASETITYVVSSPLTLRTTGNGTVSPDLNGQFLEIGKSYTISAFPGSGFLFTNWTGGVTANKAILTFSMQSNLVLTANFVDIGKPLVTITYPPPLARSTNGTVTLQGHASDNKGVVQVFYQLGNAPYQPASGTTNWSASLLLTAGPNVVRVKSVDAAGNESAFTSETFTYVMLSPLTISTNGSGTVSPNLNGHLLEVGQPYILTAVPSAGFLFSNWIGGVTAGTAQLSFKMQPNLALSAQFVPNPFTPVQGTYNGLFYQTSGVLHASSGFFKLSLTNGGTFSGILMLAGTTASFNGQFGVSGRAQQQVPRLGQSTLLLDLRLDLAGGTDQIQGTVSDGTWMAELLADRSSANSGIHPYAGYYNLSILGDPIGGLSPAGDGYALVSVGSDGSIAAQGRLADGELINQATAISKNGEWPFYVSLYGGRGSILSWITFTNGSMDNLNGLASWIRPGLPATRYYPVGFTNETTIIGSRYTPPIASALNFTNGQVVFRGADCAQPLTNRVILNPFDKVINQSGNPLAFYLLSSDGLFAGNFSVPGSGLSEWFVGVLLPSRNAGFGCFFGTNQVGEVRFEAAP